MTRMPTADFLLTRRETITDASAADGLAQSEAEWVDGMEDEMFDDFVVLNPPDF